MSTNFQTKSEQEMIDASKAEFNSPSTAPMIPVKRKLVFRKRTETNDEDIAKRKPAPTITTLMVRSNGTETDDGDIAKKKKQDPTMTTLMVRPNGTETDDGDSYKKKPASMTTYRTIMTDEQRVDMRKAKFNAQECTSSTMKPTKRKRTEDGDVLKAVDQKGSMKQTPSATDQESSETRKEKFNEQSTALMIPLQEKPIESEQAICTTYPPERIILCTSYKIFKPKIPDNRIQSRLLLPEESDMGDSNWHVMSAVLFDLSKAVRLYTRVTLRLSDAVLRDLPYGFKKLRLAIRCGWFDVSFEPLLMLAIDWVEQGRHAIAHYDTVYLLQHIDTLLEATVIICSPSGIDSTALMSKAVCALQDGDFKPSYSALPGTVKQCHIDDHVIACD